MYGRKTGFLAAMVLTMALFAGCTADGKVDERKARNWYNEMQGQGSVTNDVLPDGTGNYTKNHAGSTLGEDIRNAWDNVKNDVKNMGRS